MSNTEANQRYLDREKKLHQILCDNMIPKDFSDEKLYVLHSRCIFQSSLQVRFAMKKGITCLLVCLLEVWDKTREILGQHWIESASCIEVIAERLKQKGGSHIRSILSTSSRRISVIAGLWHASEMRFLGSS